MNITKFIYLLSSSILLTILLALQVFAQALPPRMPLREGMTLGQVQALWGPPDDVVEKGLQKEVLWKYKAYKRTPVTVLRFHKGQLVLSENSGELRTTVVNEKENPKQDRAKSYSFMAVENEKILGEILSEVPNGAEAPAGPGSTSPVAAPALNPVEIE